MIPRAMRHVRILNLATPRYPEASGCVVFAIVRDDSVMSARAAGYRLQHISRHVRRSARVVHARMDSARMAGLVDAPHCECGGRKVIRVESRLEHEPDARRVDNGQRAKVPLVTFAVWHVRG